MKKFLLAAALFLAFISLANAQAIFSNPYPANGSYVPGGTINFTVLVTKNLNVSSATLHIIAKDAYERGEPWKDFNLSCGNYNASHYVCYTEILFSIVGSDTVEYFYYDGYDNQSIYSSLGNETNPLSFTLDRNPPNIGFVNPKNNTYVKGKVNLTVSIKDISAGVDEESVYYRINNASWTKMEVVANNTFSAVFDTTGYENNQSLLIEVKASDLVGNQRISNITVWVDNEKPKLQIIKPASHTIYGSNVEMEVVANDSYSGIDTGSAELRVASWTQAMNCVSNDGNATCSAFFDTTIFQDGNYTFNFSIKDRAGNLNYTTKIFEIRNAQPLVEIINTETYISKDTTIKASVNDPNQIVQYLQISIKNATYDSGAINMSYDASQQIWYYDWVIDNFADGSYNVSVIAINTQNLQLTASKTFVIDRVRPNIIISKPDYASQTVLISIIVDDEIRSSSNVNLSVGGYAASLECSLQLSSKRAVCNTQLDTLSLQNGKNLIEVYASDAAGNLAYKQDSIWVDNDLPLLNYLRIYPIFSVSPTDVEFYVYASDNTTNVSSVTLTTTLLGQSSSHQMKNMGDYWYAKVALSMLGQYNVSITLVDLASNSKKYENVGTVFIGNLNCGNNVCDEFENYCICPSDCTFSCPKGSIDCGNGKPACISPSCGDGICMENEINSCKQDCLQFQGQAVQQPQKNESVVQKFLQQPAKTIASITSVVLENPLIIFGIASVAGLAIALLVFGSKPALLAGFEKLLSDAKSSLLSLSLNEHLADDLRAAIISLENFKQKSIKDFYKQEMTVERAEKLENYLKQTDFDALEKRRIEKVDGIAARLKQLIIEKDEQKISQELQNIKQEWGKVEEIVKMQKEILKRFK